MINRLERFTVLTRQEVELIDITPVLLETVEGETEILPGLRVLPSPGHTPGHQSVLLDAADPPVLFLGDVVPTSVHVIE